MLSVCVLGCVFTYFSRGPEDSQFGRLEVQGLIIATGFIYAVMRVLKMRASVSPWLGWLQATVEVAVVALIMLVDLNYLGPIQAFTSPMPFVFSFSVSLNSLRLDPRLSIYAGVLAAIAQLSIYAAAYAQFADFAPSRAVQIPYIVFRSLLLVVIGVFGFVLARTLRAEIKRAAAEQQQRERVRSAFGSYVDARVVDRVMGGDLKITAEERVITVMFIDIRGFTSLADSTAPPELFAKLTEALEAFSIEIAAQGGLVNKFLGDGLMAIFGAPEAQVDHPVRAVRAALKIVEATRARREDGRFPGLAIGVGIHTGNAMVGDLGSSRREYTAIGDTVNVAARVESANKELGSVVLITEAVRAQLGSLVELKPHLGVAVKGKAAQLDLYEVVL